MPLTRLQSEFSYSSGDGSLLYYFTIVVDQTGIPSVRDIRTPVGSLCDSYATLPESVLADIDSAKSQVEALLSLTSQINGTLTYAAETSQAVLFSTPLPDTSYRVYVSVGDFISYRITNKSTLGFTVELNVSYTGTISYDVLV